MTETGNNAGNGAEQRRPSASEAELAADLKPAGALERMMIQQMARAHDTTLACFDRAEGASEPAACEIELRLAARFMALFMQQAGALDRRRAQARQAEEAARRETFDADLTRSQVRLAFWEQSLRRFEGAAAADAGGRDQPDGLENLDERDDLEDLADPAALRDMAERPGLPSPIGADGQIDPDALEALAERVGTLALGSPDAGPTPTANGAGKQESA